MRPSAALYTHDLFQTPFAKTAHGLVRGPSRYEITALVDSAGAGRDAGELLDGTPRGIPVFASIDTLCGKRARPPDFIVIGIATSGGVLPPEMKAALLGAVERGIGIVNGLHELLSEDRIFAAEARKSGAQLVDVRKPKPRGELHFWSGRIRDVRAPRIAVLGTDCALGKRTTCHVIAAACRARDIATEIVYTGQTGWLQGLQHGFILDSTPNDFVSGELEHAIFTCDREASPHLILLEGQSALRNPSGPCGAELLLSGEARGVVLQHAPARRLFEDQEHLHNEIPPLREEIELIRLYGARVLGLTLNNSGLADAELEPARERIERETGLPAVYPLKEGVERLVPAIREHVAAHAKR